MIKNAFVLLFGYLVLGVTAADAASAQECSGTITAEEALRAEDARYTAQTTNDFATMQKLFGEDLVYIHSSAAVDDKAAYIESMRSGNVKYRTMKRSNVKVRTYGCIAVLTGDADFDVTVKGQELSVQLRFHTVYAKRPAGVQFVSWQATRVPA
ncbi:MAG TPA: nuclear transport factor 2 family protein [Burkholderiales bacterium]|nr:nuclear transport factor 2 family protein [Burkholderiales bacterium]